MTIISEFVAALNQAKQVVGDLPVVLHDLEHGAETVARDLGFSISLGGGEAASSVVINHGPAASAPAESSSTGSPPTEASA